MAASDLDAELRRGADATAQALVRDARDEAARVEAEADRSIQATRATAFERWEEELRGEARAEIAAARRDATRAMLLAKARLVERVLDRTRRELESLSSAQTYQATLVDELERAMEFVEAKGATVRCGKALAATVKDAVSSRHGAKIEVDESIGSGFIVSDAGGRAQVDATLEDRLRRLAPQLSVEILRRVEELDE